MSITKIEKNKYLQYISLEEKLIYTQMSQSTQEITINDIKHSLLIQCKCGSYYTSKELMYHHTKKCEKFWEMDINIMEYHTLCEQISSENRNVSFWIIHKKYETTHFYGYTRPNTSMVQRECNMMPINELCKYILHRKGGDLILQTDDILIYVKCNNDIRQSIIDKLYKIKLCKLYSD